VDNLDSDDDEDRFESHFDDVVGNDADVQADHSDEDVQTDSQDDDYHNHNNDVVHRENTGVHNNDDNPGENPGVHTGERTPMMMMTTESTTMSMVMTAMTRSSTSSWRLNLISDMDHVPIDIIYYGEDVQITPSSIPPIPLTDPSQSGLTGTGQNTKILEKWRKCWLPHR
jgi:hypothetical protein